MNIRRWFSDVRDGRDRQTEERRLEALRTLLIDPRLGPVWWIDRFVDRELREGNTGRSVEEILNAFNTVRNRIAEYEVSGLQDDRVWFRKRLDELFARYEDPAVMDHLLRLADVLLADGGAEKALRDAVITRLDDSMQSERRN